MYKAKNIRRPKRVGGQYFWFQMFAQNFSNPILKSKASTTIRQIQKHLRKHLWPNQEINLEDVIIFINFTDSCLL